MSRRLTINGFEINDDSDCFVIAEIGNNHQGSLEKCKEMFRIAKECGANAVKLQKRDNRALYTKAAFDRPYDHENSFGLTYGEHREFLEFGAYEYQELKKYAEEVGITFFSTAFDIPSADFLGELDMPAYKIASGDLKSLPLIKHVAQFQKPMIVSTGAATLEDVQRVYDAIMPINPQLCILQCTASYPADFEELELKVIETYRELFGDIVIGLSSHDNGIAMAVAAYVLGARVIEKHFTLNRAMKGTDHAFSLEPTGLRKMVRDLRRTRQAFGDGVKKVHLNERPAYLKMGKKLVAADNLPVGHVLRAEDIAMKSPGDGLPPYELDNVIGKVLTKPLRVDESITLAGLVENVEQVAV
ncbi:N-acetylneuraminate synthase [Moorena producens PAL-8-15-08-1]|uniref:N-acetylneuraminate synthase n=1 Tax=Moorena producens PAL-8-15-08-1 TaxID=1458985 RepID=A0A1D8TY43_9CYAN|nr:N-acetylneuraminate synthase family protein [Moorena producens]AOX02579.1 N-acetylneuraminate synthase [Moorena producens PAL-8-15-08-1]